LLKLSRLQSGQPEIFPSIQGEGPSRGLPSVFLRLALCNLRCSWCDTRYTWDWERYDRRTEIVEMDPGSVVREIERFGHRNVVITGGEPLLQQRVLVPLAVALKRSGRRLEVETNGTLTPVPTLADAVDQWNVSPKLASSGNPAALREAKASLSFFATRASARFKFVVCAPADVDGVRELVDRYGVPAERVTLMPEAQDPSTLVARNSWLAPACREAGFDLSPRLQIILWGGARAR
jgi:7-carboxy-7-deazaguanine synthase